MADRSSGRSNALHKRLRANFKTQCRSTSAVCHLCKGKIDYSAERAAPNAFELDHYYPVSTHPQLINDPANFRPACSKCNRSRGVTPMDRMVTPVWEQEVVHLPGGGVRIGTNWYQAEYWG